MENSYIQDNPESQNYINNSNYLNEYIDNNIFIIPNMSEIIVKHFNIEHCLLHKINEFLIPKKIDKNMEKELFCLNTYKILDKINKDIEEFEEAYYTAMNRYDFNIEIEISLDYLISEYCSELTQEEYYKFKHDVKFLYNNIDNIGILNNIYHYEWNLINDKYIKRKISFNKNDTKRFIKKCLNIIIEFELNYLYYHNF